MLPMERIFKILYQILINKRTESNIPTKTTTENGVVIKGTV
jgi:hypothetical protein